MDVNSYSRRHWLKVSVGAMATLALAACGAPAGSSAGAVATSDSATAPAITSASATVAAATSSVAPAVSSTTALSSVSAPAVTPSASSSAVSSTQSATSSVAAATSSGAAPVATTAMAAASSGVKLTLNASGTQASYQVQEQLASKNFPTPAIGRTSAVTGAIALDANGKIVSGQSKFEIDLRTLKSDQGMRDSYIQHDPLQTSQYPMATFVPSQVTGMPWPLPSAGTAKFNLVGDMTVHGTSASTTWAVEATFAGSKVTGTATTPFTFTEFGMTAPHTMIALSVENNGTLTLQFSATKASA